jgi:hypothetical protein
MGFDPYNYSLKIWESIGTPKMGAHLGVHWDSQNGSSFGNVEVHSLTPSHTLESMKCDSCVSLLTRTFASLYLGCKLKVRLWHKLICLIGSIILITKTSISLIKQNIQNYSISKLCKDDAFNHILKKLIGSNHFYHYLEVKGETWIHPLVTHLSSW